jgi:ABC-2 type transport system permease protein
MTVSMAAQVRYLAGRSVTRTLRQPAYVFPPLIFPIALLAVNSAGLQASTHLPGFPSHRFLPFALAVCFMQGALFATMNAGTDLARDIQTGFLNRLALTPLRAPALIVGHLAGVTTMGFLQACFYLAVGLVAGSGLEAGAGGAMILLLLATLIAAAFGAVGAFLALRTGSAESVQGFFPLLFVGLFISSMNAPRNLMAVTWFRDIATGNPVSYLIEGVRSLIIEGWNGQALALAFGVSAVIMVVALAAASSALRMRLTRT